MLNADIRPVTNTEFRWFQKLILENVGINLGPSKKNLLMGRLGRRLRALGLKTFTEYYDYLGKKENVKEKTRFIDCICTNETRFFREIGQFEFLETQVLPSFETRAKEQRNARSLRVLSVGCSTGEEPFSLAMVLRKYFPPSSRWFIEIIGTDLSSRALQAAEKAVWDIKKAEEIPEEYLKLFMMKGTGGKRGTMKGAPEIRSMVRFHFLNLKEEGYPLKGKFDLIFCRNVLIYFKMDFKRIVVRNLMSFLNPGGFFFLGNSESLTGISDTLIQKFPAVYQHPG